MELSKLFKISYLPLISLPFVASADMTVRGLFETGTDIISSIIVFLEVLAVAVFLWGIVKFIASSGNPEKRKTAKDLIVYGLIGMFVLMGFWGIIEILQNTIFSGPPPQTYTPPNPPMIP